MSSMSDIQLYKKFQSQQLLLIQLKFIRKLNIKTANQSHCYRLLHDYPTSLKSNSWITIKRHRKVLQKKIQQLQMFAPIDQFYNDYQVGQQLGRGAFAICYQATNRITQQLVAAKKINLLDYNQPPQNILNEINLLKSLDHPNIIRFINAFEAKDHIIIVTDYQNGRDLQQITLQKQEEKPFRKQDIWQIARQLLEGIAYLHANGIIHRDIKPSNIFITDRCDVKIGDLGASKLVQQSNYTRIGTPFYLPPEIIRHENYSYPADIWSLGVTLYHLTYLQLPFRAGNIIRLGQMIVDSQPEFPSEPARMQEMIQRMLRKNESERPTAKELLAQYFQEKGYFQEEQQQAKLLKEEQSIMNLGRQDPMKDRQVSSDFAKEQDSYPDENEDEDELNLQTFVDPIISRESPHRRTNLSTHKPLQRKNTHLAKTLLSENQDETIVLTVNYNPSDIRTQSTMLTHFNRPPSNIFNSIEEMSQNSRANGKKGSCFRQNAYEEFINNANPPGQKFKIQVGSHNSGHRRVQSAIQSKLRHSELMLKMKARKGDPLLRHSEDDSKQIGKNKQESRFKPQIIEKTPTFVLLR